MKILSNIWNKKNGFKAYIWQNPKSLNFYLKFFERILYCYPWNINEVRHGKNTWDVYNLQYVLWSSVDSTVLYTRNQIFKKEYVIIEISKGENLYKKTRL